jgi:urease gamma subunit
MANKTLSNVIIQLRNDTASAWNSSSYVLRTGELGLDTTNAVIKIGDGTHVFSELPNAGSVIAEASAYDADTNPGGKDRNHGGLKVNGVDINTFTLTVADTSVIGAVLSQAVEASGEHAGYAHIGDNYLPGYVTVANDGKMTVQVVAAAEKLYTARTITVEDGISERTDVEGSFTFDGSSDVSFQLQLKDQADVDVASNTTSTRATVVNVNKQGLVVGTDVIVSSDITDAKAASTGSTDAAKAIKTNANGKLDDTFLNKTLAASDAQSLGSFNAKAGAYTVANVTVDEQGRVTNISAEATTATSAGAADASKLVRLNAAGKLDDTLIPNLAIGQVYTTDDYEDLTDSTKKAAFISANNIQGGDVVVVATDVTSITDADRQAANYAGTLVDYKASLQANDGVYFYVDNSNSGNGTYVLIKAPGTAVQTVNGHYGPNVTLITDDIAEDGTSVTDLVAGSTTDAGHNRYFTQARVKAYLDSISVRSTFTDGDDLILTTDSLVISAGSSTVE